MQKAEITSIRAAIEWQPTGKIPSEKAKVKRNKEEFNNTGIV